MLKSQLKVGVFYENFQKAYNEELLALIKNYLTMDFSDSDLKFLRNKIRSEDLKDKHLGVIGLRKLLYLEENKIIVDEIPFSVIHDFVKWLEESKYPQLQIEAFWILNKLIKLKHKSFRVHHFSIFLKSKYPEIIEQAKKK